MTALASLGQLLPVLLALALALYAWPRALVRLRACGLSPALAYAVLGSALWVAATLVLGALRIVQFATLLAVAGALAAAAQSRRRRAVPPAARARGTAGLVAGLELVEAGTAAVLAGFGRAVTRARADTRARLGRGLSRPADVLLTAALVATFAWHLAPYLGQAAPASARAYEWLLLGKLLALNQGLWRGGVAPPGLPAAMAALSSLFALNMLNLLRVAAPLAALLLAAGAAALAESLSSSRWAAFVAAVLVGLTRLPGLGSVGWSPTEPLAARLAAGLALLIVALAARPAVLRRLPGRLVLGASAFLCASLDPRTAAAGLAAAAALLALLRPGRAALAALVVALLAATAALAAPTLGLLTGAQAVPALWQAAAPAPALAGRLLALAPAAALAAAVLAHAALYPGVGRSRRGRARIALARTLLVLCLALAVLPAGAVAAPIAAALPTLLTLPLAAAWLLSHSLRHRPRTAAGGALVAAFAALALAPQPPAALARYEPPGSAQTYLRIAAAYPKYTWTIVSPVTQYPEVLGAGWHTELSQFVRDETLAEAHSPRFRLDRGRPLAIRTPVVFLFVALEPDGPGRPLSASDARLPLPPPSAPNPYSGRYGAAIEARALLWARAYLASHPRSASIYARSPSLLVLRILQ